MAIRRKGEAAPAAPKRRRARAKAQEGSPRLKKALETIAALPVSGPSRPVATDEAVLYVRRSRYADGVLVPGSESDEEQRVATPRFDGEVARVRVAHGMTRSLGGFEFARVDVMVELPCQPNPQDIDETSLFASEKASEFLARELGSLEPHPVNPAVIPHANMSALTHAAE